MKRRRFIAVIVALCLIIPFVPRAAGYVSPSSYGPVEYWDGSVDTSWYNSAMTSVTLYTGAQLAGLAKIVQSGKDTFIGKTIRLGTDIVLNENVLDDFGQPWGDNFYQWLPIGCYEGGWQPFSGTFDGQGHVISGLYDNQTTAFNDDKNHGLFGYLHTAEVKNITLTDSYIYAYDYVGGIVGNAYNSSVINCCAYASVGGPVHVGGIAGAAAMDSVIQNCFAAGSVTSNRFVGGVAGYVDATSTLDGCVSASVVGINEGAYDNFGASIPNGGVAGVADTGASITGCYYLFGTAGGAVGDGEGETGFASQAEFDGGMFIDLLSAKAVNQGGLCQWTTSGGWPMLDGGYISLDYEPYLELPMSGRYTDNFKMEPSLYKLGQFIDVDESGWYGSYGNRAVKTAVCLGIMNGYTDGTFKPDQSLKLCEAIKMALTVYDVYNYGSPGQYEMGTVWYTSIVSSAIEKGIIKAGDFTNYEADAARCEMAYIFANALPESELETINETISPPDVYSDTDFYSSIIALYRAGVLTGNDSQGTFAPYETITRCQAASIIARMAVTSMRKG